MISDFIYDLKDEKLYYEISNKLDELYELEKEEKAKLASLLPKPPVLDTYRPSLSQINEYTIDLYNYNKQYEEYQIIKSNIKSSKSWQELINSYVSHCYGESSIPMDLVEKFVFNKYKYKKYSEIFQEYIEMLDWFESKNIFTTDSYYIENLLSRITINTRKDYSAGLERQISRLFIELNRMQDVLMRDYKKNNK